jgi:hypothetical protein
MHGGTPRMLNAQGLMIFIRLFKCTEKVCCSRKTRLGAGLETAWAIIITAQSKLAAGVDNLTEFLNEFQDKLG